MFGFSLFKPHQDEACPAPKTWDASTLTMESQLQTKQPSSPPALESDQRVVSQQVRTACTARRTPCIHTSIHIQSETTQLSMGRHWRAA